MQRRRNGEWRQGSIEPIALAVLDEDTGFEHRLSQFLDEQRIAVGLDHDLFCDFGGQRTATRDPRDHVLDVRSI